MAKNKRCFTGLFSRPVEERGGVLVEALTALNKWLANRMQLPDERRVKRKNQTK